MQATIKLERLIPGMPIDVYLDPPTTTVQALTDSQGNTYTNVEQGHWQAKAIGAGCAIVTVDHEEECLIKIVRRVAPTERHDNAIH